jgi:ribonuclease P protein subunit RPR2
MAKEKAKKGVPNKHLHARIAYLHQAVTYLSEQSLIRPRNDIQQPTERMVNLAPGTLALDATHSLANSKPSPAHPSTATFNKPPSGLPLQLNAHLRSVAQKAQIRLSSDLKTVICKICSSPLIEGETCLRSTENLSKGGRKPWADVLVLKCCACGACKRFPVGAKKQKRKSARGAKKHAEDVVTAGAAEGQSRNGNVDPENGTIAELQIRPAN